MTGARVLGVDSGGSGLRVALADAGAARRAGAPPAPGTLRSSEPVRTGPGGIDADHLLEQVVPMARALLDADPGGGPPVAVAVGAAGMASLGERLRAEVPGALARLLGVGRVALASDAVTAYAGALGQRPGAVVAGGTGMVALGTDLTRWRRADGWGHLLGDCGGGAWIGRAGLEAALRAHDGREGGSPALLAAAESAFGPARELPDRVYPRPDRPAVLASFAPEVGRCAADGDAVAARILALAARHVAEAAGAVCPEVPRGAPMSATGRRVVAGGPLAGGAPGAVAVAAVGPPEVALTGGLFRMGAPLLVPLREELSRRLPYARLVPAAGDPLDGALVLASALASGSLLLPRHPTLLHVPMESGA